MKIASLLLALAALSLHAAEKPADKPVIDPPREELEKLGGFKPAPSDPAVFNIHIEMQVVAIQETDALPLIEQMKDPAQIEKANGVIQDMIGKKRATLIGWPMLIAKSGQRAVVENITEIRYATEFSPPQGIAPAVQAPEPALPAGGAPKKDAAAKAAAANNGDVCPTAFETRNVGVTLEIEAVLDADSMEIEIQMAPQHVRLLHFDKLVTETDGRKIAIEQPRFESSKMNTNMSVQSGQRILLGSFRVTEPADHIELFIFKATAKPAHPKQPAPAPVKKRAR